MKFADRSYFARGIAAIGAGALFAVPLASAPLAGATGGAGGSGGTVVTGPGGSPVTSVNGQIIGTETVPGGTPGIPSCITGGCSGSLTTIVGTGTGGTPTGGTGLQVTPTINLPPNPISCITAQCHGNGSLGGSAGISTPIVGVSGALSGGLHG